MAMDIAAILDMAIMNEIEAHEFYQGVAAKTADKSVQGLFTEFAAEELKHRQLLEQLKKKPDLKAAFPASADYRISEGVALPPLTTDLKPVDAIALAMKKEEAAMRGYQALAATAQQPEAKQLFEGLARMEQGHKARMEDLYTNTAFPEAW
jgi:rubrerythrin